jgi:hypothetical protein
MPEDLLSRIRSEIDERLTELRPLVEEIPRLEVALAALRRGGSQGDSPPRRARRRTQPNRVGPKRAPRGANRKALLEAVERRPGASAAELASVTGIKLATARTTLSSLVKGGAVTRDAVGGVPGYHLAS